MLLAALLAHAGHHRALDAADDVGAVVELLDHPDHGLNLRLGGAGLHYDDHVVLTPRSGATFDAQARTSSSRKVEIVACRKSSIASNGPFKLAL